MRTRLLSILLDLALLLVSLVVVLCGVAVALGVFFAVVLALGLVAQRQPPYPMEPGVWP
jgi:uncharacterized oligopeptide transporter (OPT) family protein